MIDGTGVEGITLVASCDWRVGGAVAEGVNKLTEGSVSVGIMIVGVINKAVGERVALPSCSRKISANTGVSLIGSDVEGVTSGDAQSASKPETSRRIAAIVTFGDLHKTCLPDFFKLKAN